MLSCRLSSSPLSGFHGLYFSAVTHISFSHDQEDGGLSNVTQLALGLLMLIPSNMDGFLLVVCWRQMFL